MWLINCSYEDIIMLYYNPIYCEEKDGKQAMKYHRVVCFCFAWDVNAGCDYNKLLGKYVKVQEMKKSSHKQQLEPESSAKQRKTLKIKLMNKTLEYQEQQSKK